MFTFPKKKFSWKLWVLILLIMFGFFIGFLYHFITSPLPNESDNKVVVYDRNGAMLYSDIPFYKPTTLSDFEDISKLVVLMEDAEFYDHFWVSLRGLLRASRDQLHQSWTSGGSTITMQLAGLRYLSDEEHTYIYKLKQILLALKLEYHLSKHEILGEYLHRVYLGSGAIWFPAASNRYFWKPITSLSFEEQALLVGILPRPEWWSPVMHPEKAKIRRNIVLDKYAHESDMDPQTKQYYMDSPLTLSIQDPNPIHAPHFVFWILDRHISHLNSYINHIHTTLDLDQYEQARNIISAVLDSPWEIDQASTSIIGIKDHEIHIMVGSKDFFSSQEHSQINMTTRKRQMGSTLKPFLFAYALENDHSPTDIIHDIRGGYTAAKWTYDPTNFHADEQYGFVRFREALWGSYNLSVIQLLDTIWVARWLQYLQMIGMKMDQDAQNVWLSVALGTSESTLLDLTWAYTIFLNDGIQATIHGIKNIQDISHNTVYTPTHKEHKVMHKNTAQWITHVLSDISSKWAIFSRGSALELEFETASKTGTSQDYRDHYAVGYSPEVTVGVWRGYPDGQPLTKNEKSQLLWHNIMHILHTGEKNTFTYTWDRKPIRICADPQSPLSACSHVYTEYILDSESKNSTSKSLWFRITSPSDGDRFHPDSQIYIQTFWISDTSKLQYFLNDARLPWALIENLPPGTYTVSVQSWDLEQSSTFTVESK